MKSSADLPGIFAQPNFPIKIATLIREEHMGRYSILVF
jgi:hypothetical protein